MFWRRLGVVSEARDEIAECGRLLVSGDQLIVYLPLNSYLTAFFRDNYMGSLLRSISSSTPKIRE